MTQTYKKPLALSQIENIEKIYFDQLFILTLSQTFIFYFENIKLDYENIEKSMYVKEFL